jgi:hypothetical protein
MRTFDRSGFEIGSWRAWSVWLARLVGLVVVFGFSLLLGTASSGSRHPLYMHIAGLSARGMEAGVGKVAPESHGSHCTYGNRCSSRGQCTAGDQCSVGKNCTGGRFCSTGPKCTSGARCFMAIPRIDILSTVRQMLIALLCIAVTAVLAPFREIRHV